MTAYRLVWAAWFTYLFFLSDVIQHDFEHYKYLKLERCNKAFALQEERLKLEKEKFAEYGAEAIIYLETYLSFLYIIPNLAYIELDQQGLGCSSSYQHACIYSWKNQSHISILDFLEQDSTFTAIHFSGSDCLMLHLCNEVNGVDAKVAVSALFSLFAFLYL
ncbi:hypothetical protein ACJX0J_025290 [Zea mays]